MATNEALAKLAKLGAVDKLAEKVAAKFAAVEAAIPTNTNQLTNGSGYQTANDVNTAISSQIGRVYKAGGSKAFAELPAASAETLGYIYNITDAFTTTADFVEGADKNYSAGTDVGVVQVGETYKYNVFANFVDTSNFVTQETGKGLSTNDYTTAEQTKLSGIATGATKVEASTTEGNIKINGEEVTVIGIATDAEANAVIESYFPTDTGDSGSGEQV